MNFDPDNKVVKLCARGMELEGEGKSAEAAKKFEEAWNIATNNHEKFTAAHYVARHQKDILNKLKWDKTALNCALKIEGKEIKDIYPSLYLNVAKCYEDLNDVTNAKKHYELALNYTAYLPDDGYGKMIHSGILNGLKRISEPLSDKPEN